MRELAILLAEPGQLLALFLHQPALALRPLGTGVLDPEAERRGRQIQLAGDGAHGLAFVQDQPDRPFFELVRELPPDAPATTA